MAVLAVIGIALASSAPSAAQIARIRPVAVRQAPSEKAGKTVPIVNADDELAGFLSQAQDLIKDNKFREALDILQSLIDQNDTGFVAVEEGRRFVSLASKANDAIGSMNAQGLEFYRSVHGPKAMRMFEEANRSGDLNALRRVARQYAHTIHGRLALLTVAAMNFDRAQYSQAAQLWREALSGRIDESEHATLLARVAVSEHLGGDAAQAAKALATLQQRFPEAQGFVGGRRQNLAGFVREMMTVAPNPQWAPQPAGDWPGLGGVSDGMATMSDADVVLAPHWRYPPAGGSTLTSDNLIAADESMTQGNAHQQMRLDMTLRRGMVSYRQQFGQQVREGIVPAMVQPVVIGSTVIFRTDESVIACDIFSPAQPLWKANFAMTRKSTARNGSYYYYRPVPSLDDGGRYVLTCGDGKVFALGEFSSMMNRMMMARGNDGGQARDGATLAAFSMTDQGVNLWRLPNSQVKEDIVNDGKFVSPPTYCRGRLYIVTHYLDSYHLLCLDARSGALLWTSLISQAPIVPMQYYAYGIANLIERCSNPAVSEGRVFVLTNAGAVAAYDAQSGQAVWAYQYDSSTNTSEGVQRLLAASGYGGMAAQAPMPRNPLIVCQGRLLCLPADSEQAMAFSTEDGKLLWERSREGLRDLSAIDPQRVLLSSPGLAVVGTRDGKILSQPSEAKDIIGRPAVSAKCALASTEGKLVRFSLDKYTLQSSDLVDAAALLGNLVSVDGKLIAANAAGVCAYLDYDRMLQRLTEQFEQSPPGAKKCDALFQRLRLSFNARRFDAALADVEACHELAQQANETALVPQLASWKYRTLVALGNSAPDGEKMLAFFTRARAAAGTSQEKAHMLIRLAKCMDKLGRAEEAADLAQELAESHPQEELVDVEIGPDADLGVRLDGDMQRYTGEVIGQRIIERLLEIQGPTILEKFDRLAKAAMDAAAAKDDPAGLAAVAARWPHSAWADDALMAAAESWYRTATTAAASQPARQSKDAMDKAIASLSTLAYMTGSPLRPSATIALAILHGRSGKTAIPILYCNLVRNLPPQTPIKFADIEGTLGELIQKIEAGSVAAPPTEALGRVPLPLKELMTVGEKAIILRDQDLRPLRVGTCIFLRQVEHVVMFDTAAADAEKALRWRTKVRPLALLPVHQGAGRGYSMGAAMSADGKVLMLVDKQNAIRLNAADGKLLEEMELAKLGVHGVLSIGAGSGVIAIADPTGGLVCIDVAKGAPRWPARLGNPNDRNTPILPVDPPQISDRFMLVRHRGSRLTCFDLVSGKVLNQWRGQNVDGCLGEGAMMAVMSDGVVTMHDGSATEALWTRKYDSKPDQQIMGMFADRLYVCRGGSAIDVLSITRGGQLLGTLQGANVSGFVPDPVSLSLVGDKVVVVYSLSNLQLAVGSRAANNYCRGMVVQAFDAAGKRLWTTTIDASPTNVYFASPVMPAREQVLLMCQSTNYSRPVSLRILSAGDGKEAARVDVPAAGPPVNNETYIRRFMIGPPVVIGNRAGIEGSNGVTVYGEE